MSIGCRVGGILTGTGRDVPTMLNFHRSSQSILVEARRPSDRV
jgi:hypothetical protein